jgi:hypothetical protein
MKLLIDTNRIVGTATNSYTGPMEFIQAPEGFNETRLDEYILVGGELTIPEPEPINPVPASVTKRQGRQQMILIGLLSQVQAAIDAIEDETQRMLIQSFWDDSTQYERNHPQMVQLAQAIGLTEDQLDDAFIAAAKL